MGLITLHKGSELLEQPMLTSGRGAMLILESDADIRERCTVGGSGLPWWLYQGQRDSVGGILTSFQAAGDGEKHSSGRNKIALPLWK